MSERSVWRKIVVATMLGLFGMGGQWVFANDTVQASACTATSPAAEWLSTSARNPRDGSLAVPSHLLPLSDPAGQARLFSASANQAYWHLSEFFTTQKNRTYCAIASGVVVLNALRIPRPYSASYPHFPYFTQDEFLDGIDPRLAGLEHVLQKGIGFDTFTRVLAHFDVTVHATRASELTLSQFRDAIRESTSRTDQFVLLNFARKEIGQVGNAHWSPLAAFDAETDTALLLDVGRNKYPSVWVPVTQLYQAAYVSAKDGRSRGIIVVARR